MTPGQEAAVRMVLRAWGVPGPRPRVHRLAQAQLRKRWPALGLALDAMALAFAVDKRKD